MIDETLHVQLERLQAIANRDLSYDEAALAKEYHEQRDNEGTTGMKILAIGGAFLATVCLIGFILATGVYDSPAGIGGTGGVMLLAAWWLNRGKKSAVLFDSFSISLTFCGYVLVLIGFAETVNSAEGMALLACFLALVVLALYHNKIISFLATVAAASSLLFWAHEEFQTYGAHAYVIFMVLVLMAWFIFEARLLKSSEFIFARYDGIRAGLVLALLLGAYYLSDFRWWLPDDRSANWYASLVLIPLTGYVSWGLLRRFVPSPSERGLYAAGVLTLLLPTFFAPALSATLLLLLLSWKVGYRTGTVLAIIALIYFVSRYYYDLNLTLLTKSIVMMVSGVLFLIAFALLRKKLNPR